MIGKHREELTFTRLWIHISTHGDNLLQSISITVEMIGFNNEAGWTDKLKHMFNNIQDTSNLCFSVRFDLRSNNINASWLTGFSSQMSTLPVINRIPAEQSDIVQGGARELKMWTINKWVCCVAVRGCAWCNTWYKLGWLPEGSFFFSTQECFPLV